MKTFIIIFLFFLQTWSFADILSIDNSKLINGNTLVFKSDNDEVINLSVKNDEINFEKLCKKSNNKGRILKKFLKTNNIFTISQAANMLLHLDSLIGDKTFFIVYKNILYKCIIETAEKEEDTIFAPFSTLQEISIVAKSSISLNTFEISNNFTKKLFSLSIDRKKNICLIYAFGKNYQLIYVTNHFLDEYNQTTKKLLSNFDYSKLPITVKYAKYSGTTKITKIVTYKNGIDKYKKRFTSLLIKDKKKNKTHISYGNMHYFEEYNTLFQIKGYGKTDGKEDYRYIQYPGNRKVEVFVNNFLSTYFYSGVYYYNQAGIWYLAQEMKKYGLKIVNAFVFDGNQDAIEYKLTNDNENIYVKTPAQTIKVTFLENSNIIKEFGKFRFVDIENSYLLKLKKESHIIKVQQ